MLGSGHVQDQRALLDHLWVLPAFMRQGIERSKARGLSRMEFEADAHAVGFYERMGAHTTGEAGSDMGRRIPIMWFDLHTG